MSGLWLRVPTPERIRVNLKYFGIRCQTWCWTCEYQGCGRVPFPNEKCNLGIFGAPRPNKDVPTRCTCILMTWTEQGSAGFGSGPLCYHQHSNTFLPENVSVQEEIIFEIIPEIAALCGGWENLIQKCGAHGIHGPFRINLETGFWTRLFHN